MGRLQTSLLNTSQLDKDELFMPELILLCIYVPMFKSNLNPGKQTTNHYTFTTQKTIAVSGFDEKTRQKETLKIPKKLVTFASNRFTYSKFHNENRANRKWFEFSCTKNQVTPMVSFINIEDLKLKTKIFSEVK